MLGIFVGALALLVTLIVVFYVGIMGILLWKLAVEGAETRRVLGPPLLPAFFQNFAIPLAILGFALQQTGFVVVAGLMIATGMLLASERSIWLHPAVEAPLLQLALLTLLSVGLFRTLI